MHPDLDEYRKIISNAIDKEVESYTFYKKTADKVKDPALKTLFNDLANDEKTHREILQGFLSKDVKMLHFSASYDYKVVDDSATPNLNPDMKPVDGLVLAIKKELGAMQMYTQFAKASAQTGKGGRLALWCQRREHIWLPRTRDDIDLDLDQPVVGRIGGDNMKVPHGGSTEHLRILAPQDSIDLSRQGVASFGFRV